MRDFLQSISRISFNLRSEKDDGNIFEEEPTAYECFKATMGNWKNTIIVGMIFIVIGLSSGLFVSWAGKLSEELASQTTDIEKMFEKIDGYLERDEQRELDE